MKRYRLVHIANLDIVVNHPLFIFSHVYHKQLIERMLHKFLRFVAYILRTSQITTRTYVHKLNLKTFYLNRLFLLTLYKSRLIQSDPFNRITRITNKYCLIIDFFGISISIF